MDYDDGDIQRLDEEKAILKKMATHWEKMPESFEEWLIKARVAPKYCNIFLWDHERVFSEYKVQSAKMHESTQNINLLSRQFRELHDARLKYMQKHDIKLWSELNPKDDAIHMEMKDEFSVGISSIVAELKDLKGVRDEVQPVLALLAGIVDGSYTDFGSLIAYQRSVREFIIY